MDLISRVIPLQHIIKCGPMFDLTSACQPKTNKYKGRVDNLKIQSVHCAGKYFAKVSQFPSLADIKCIEKLNIFKESPAALCASCQPLPPTFPTSIPFVQSPVISEGPLVVYDFIQGYQHPQQIPQMFIDHLKVNVTHIQQLGSVPTTQKQ